MATWTIRGVHVPRGGTANDQDLVTTTVAWRRPAIIAGSAGLVLALSVAAGTAGGTSSLDTQLALGRFAGYLTAAIAVIAVFRGHIRGDAGAKRTGGALLVWGTVVGLGSIAETPFPADVLPEHSLAALRIAGLAVTTWLLVAAMLRIQVGAQVSTGRLAREVSVPLLVCLAVAAELVVIGDRAMAGLDGPVPSHGGIVAGLLTATVAAVIVRRRQGSIEDGTSLVLLATITGSEILLATAHRPGDPWVVTALSVHVTVVAALAGYWLAEGVAGVRYARRRLRKSIAGDRERHEAEQQAELARRERIHDARSSILAVQTAALTLQKQAELDHNGHAALAEAIRSEVRRLEQLIEDDGGHRFEPFRLADAVRGPIELHRTAGHDVAMRVPEALWANGNHDDVARIVRTLLDNAAAYAPGSVVVASASSVGDELVLRITDDGPGVPTDERELVFESDVRGSTSAGTSGTGLGLAGARKLARRAGGDLRVEATSPGASFALTLPRAETLADLA